MADAAEHEGAEAAALALALSASLAEQKRALAAAEADEGAGELTAELRAAVAEAEEALGALRREQEERGRNKRPRNNDEKGGGGSSAPPPRRRRPVGGGPYRPTPTDFGALAEAHPPLRPFLVERGGKGARRRAHDHQDDDDDDDEARAKRLSALRLDFGDWRAARELTAALLAAEYGVRGWSLPEGRLVPPVPNREAYLCWVADLIALVPPPPTTPLEQQQQPRPPPSSSAAALPPPPPHPTRGLDLGCGASLIYCLLGAAGWGWRMRGVDADGDALEAAAANARAAAANAPALSPLLELARVACPPDLAPVAAALAAPAARWSDVPGAGDGVLARALRAEACEWRTNGGRREDEGNGTTPPPPPSFAFCVCNPPFFGDGADAGRNPRTDCGGAAREMVCPGGEAAFVASMVADSAALALEMERWRGAAMKEKESEGEGAVATAAGDGSGGGGINASSPPSPPSLNLPPPPPSVHWYSTMVGKKATLKAARAALHELSRAPLPDEPPRARVTAVRTTTLAPQHAVGVGGGEGAGGGGAKAVASKPSPTTRWSIAWTFSPAARGTDLTPLPPRDVEALAAGGAWLLRQER